MIIAKKKYKNNLVNTFIIVFTLLQTYAAVGQDLYIGNNAYLYFKDIVLFVNDDIRLETANSNLYLRGQSQLLQNTDSAYNSDAGKLSIYRTQTTGIYEYNYMCSPVGVPVDGTTQSNVNFIAGSDFYDPIDDTDISNVNSNLYQFTSSYNSTSTAIANYWLFKLVSAGGYSGWTQIKNTGSTNPGEGFTIKGSPNTNNVIDFRGRPNTGEILVNCEFDGTDYDPNSGQSTQVETLTGNPYPSALDLKLFLKNSTNQNVLSGEILFWEQKEKSSHYLANYEGGYGIYTPGDLNDLNDNGTYVPVAFKSYDNYGGELSSTTGTTTNYSSNNERRFAAIGQGFIIRSKDNSGSPGGGNAVFNNSMRVYFPEDSDPNGDGSIFAKTGYSKNAPNKNIQIMSHNGINYKDILENPTLVPEIKIHSQIANSYYKENIIAFRTGTPDNYKYNKFFDGKYYSTKSSDVYLLSDNIPLASKSINYNESDVIPIGLKSASNNTPFKIKVYDLVNVDKHLKIYLHDKLENTYTDIKNTSFEIELPAGTYNERFEITFANNKATLSQADKEKLKGLKIFHSNSLAKIYIKNPLLLDVSLVSLYDVSGKIILNNNTTTIKESYKISTKGLAEGTYILNLTIGNQQSISKKLIISNLQ